MKQYSLIERSLRYTIKTYCKHEDSHEKKKKYNWYVKNWEKKKSYKTSNKNHKR